MLSSHDCPGGGRPLRIAMLGIRGVPANYGGFETVAEEVGARMVERGHRVTVYCRNHNATTSDTTHRGMRRIELPSLREKHLDTPTHTGVASMHALLHRSDVVHLFGVGNAPWLPLPSGARRPEKSPSTSAATAKVRTTSWCGVNGTPLHA